MGYYSGGWSLILIAIAEVVVFAWFYGIIYLFIIIVVIIINAPGSRDPRRLQSNLTSLSGSDV